MEVEAEEETMIFGCHLKKSKLVRQVCKYPRKHPEKLKRGESHPCAKMTFEKAEQVRADKLAGMKIKDIATKYGIGKSFVMYICAGDCWTKDGQSKNAWIRPPHMKRPPTFLTTKE